MKKFLFTYEVANENYESLYYGVELPTDDYEIARIICFNIFKDMKRQDILGEEYIYIGIVLKQEI